MEQPFELRAAERVSVHRRTLLKGAAWSVPALLLVGTTPAFAQSGAVLPLFGSSDILLTREGLPSKEITFSWTLYNPAGNAPVTGLSVSIGGLTQVSITPTPSGIDPGSSATFDFRIVEGNASAALADFTINVSYTIGTESKGHTWTVRVSDSVTKTRTVSLPGGVAGGMYL